MSVAIIWWGAAGLMCAATLLESWYNQEIFLFDKNPHLWAKVIISGWGRCNVTTWFYKKQDLKDKYPNGWDFIQNAIAQFGPRKIRAWFEDHGVWLKQEQDGRVFPISDDGRDVVWAFDRLFSYHQNIHIKLKERVSSIKKSGWWFDIETDRGNYRADKVVLTTWWNAYRHTWSSGDGYAFAQELWHSITNLWPSLTSFETREKNLHELSWISFSNAKIIIQDNQRFEWPMLLTHFGITWPMVFAFSAHIPFVKISKEDPFVIKWIPNSHISYEKWMEILQDGVKLSPHKQLNNILRSYLPTRLVDLIISDLHIDPTTSLSRCTKDIFKKISQSLGHGIVIHIIWRRNGDEFVTSGWVPTHEIDSQTMQSAICSGLYFGWEIMNIDGVTWGYNLTSSWSTGRLAGISIASKL